MLVWFSSSPLPCCLFDEIAARESTSMSINIFFLDMRAFAVAGIYYYYYVCLSASHACEPLWQIGNNWARLQKARWQSQCPTRRNFFLKTIFFFKIALKLDYSFKGRARKSILAVVRLKIDYFLLLKGAVGWVMGGGGARKKPESSLTNWVCVCVCSMRRECSPWPKFTTNVKWSGPQITYRTKNHCLVESTNKLKFKHRLYIYKSICFGLI